MKAIWVFAEHHSGALERVTLELLGEARRLAREMEAEVSAVVFGDRVTALVEPLAHYGADVVHIFEDERLRHYNPGLVVAGLGRLCEAESARFVLLPATTTGSDVAYGSRWRTTAARTARHDRPRPRRQLEFVRPVAGNAVHAFVRPARSGPCLVTIAADVIGVERPDTSRSARVVREELVGTGDSAGRCGRVHRERPAHARHH